MSGAEQHSPIRANRRDCEAARLPPQPAPRRDLNPLHAVVFLPPGTPAAALWTDACGEYIQHRGYRLAAVCSAWADVVRLVFDGTADVVVVGRRDHLPRDRRPRVEVVTEASANSDQRRRPRRRR